MCACVHGDGRKRGVCVCVCMCMGGGRRRGVCACVHGGWEERCVCMCVWGVGGEVCVYGGVGGGRDKGRGGRTSAQNGILLVKENDCDQ